MHHPGKFSLQMDLLSYTLGKSPSFGDSVAYIFKEKRLDVRLA
jgi:hypothetical protein